MTHWITDGHRTPEARVRALLETIVRRSGDPDRVRCTIVTEEDGGKTLWMERSDVESMACPHVGAIS